MATTKVQAEHIAINAISGTIIADNAVTSVHIAQNAILTQHIDDGQVGTAQLAADAVTGAKLADSSVVTANIQDDQVTGDKLTDNIQIAGTLGVTGVISPTTHIDMPDNAYIKLGTDDDLQLYHNASDSIIRDAGTGRLLIGASELLVTNSGLSEAQIQSLEDGAVTLYHNGNAKLATASGGVSVTGTAFVSDGIQDTGQAGSSTIFNQSGSTADFRVESNGNANMLFVDGGNDSVGIGNSTPGSYYSNSNQLVVGSGAARQGITIASSTSTIGQLAFADGTSGDARYEGSIVYNHSSNHMELNTNHATAIYIDSSGDVFMGQTSQTGYTFAQKLVVGDGDANDGITIQSGSTHQGNLAFNHSDGTTAYGRIMYQHNTNYMEFFINNASQMLLYDGSIRPNNTNDIDLGTSSKKFKDYYGAGTLQVDGATTIGGTLGVTGATTFNALTTSTVAAGAGDAVFRWAVAGNETWQMGIDNSDADKLKIGGGTALGTTDYMTFYGSKVGIGTATPNTNSKLHVSAASSGQATSSNNTQLTVENSGTAGIQLLAGTSSVGGIWVGDSGGSEDGKIYYSNANREWSIASAGNIAMTIESSNVGIGTASPLDALHVVSAVSTDYRGNLLLSDSTAVANGAGGQLNFGGKYTGSTYTEWAGIQGAKENSVDGQYGGQLQFKTRVHNGQLATKMTLTSAGELGIGTTGPEETLSVIGDMNWTSQMYAGSGSSRRPFAKQSYWGYSSGYRAIVLGSTSTAYNTSVSGATTLCFNYDPSGNSHSGFGGNGEEIIFRNPTRFMQPNDADDNFHYHTLTMVDGKVGMGTSTPDFNLDIEGSGTPTLAVRNSSSSSNSQIHIGEINTTTYGVDIRYEGNLGNVFFDNHYAHTTRPHMHFRMQTAGTPINALTINPIGNIGIGVPDPGAKLEMASADYTVKIGGAKAIRREEHPQSGANGNYNVSIVCAVENYKLTVIDVFNSGHLYNNGNSMYARHTKFYVITESGSSRILDRQDEFLGGNATSAVGVPTITASAANQVTIVTAITSGYANYTSVEMRGSGTIGITSIS